MKRFIPIIVVGSLSLVAALVYFYRPKAVIPDTLHLNVDNIVETFDPALAYSDDALSVMSQVLEPPYQYHYLKRPYEVIPLIAEALPEISADGKNYTLRLKNDIFFHPHPAFQGQVRELHAQDFTLALKRIAFEPLQSPFRSFFMDALVGFKEFSQAVGQDWKKMKDTPIKGVVVDGQSITLQLTRQEPNLIYYLAMSALAPVPWEVVEYHQNNLSDVLVGTGPYHYMGFDKIRYHLEAFDKYREDFYPASGDRYANTQDLLRSSREKIPFVREVNFNVLNLEDERWKAFIDGQIDLMAVPGGMLPRLLGEGGKLRRELEARGVQIKHFPVQALRWLAFDMKDPVWGKNVHLRQAIAHGINIEAYIEILSQKTNLKAHSLLVPGLPGYDPSSSLPFKYNLAHARELLVKAGYPEGKGLPPLVYSTRGNQEANFVEAKFLESELAKLGIKMETRVLTFKEFLTEGRAGKLQFFTDNWFFDYPDGENILQLLVGANAPGINKAAYRDADVDRWYQQLRVTSDMQDKISLMAKIEERTLRDLPWIPLMYQSSYVLLAPHVRNYRKSSVARNYVKYIKLGPQEKK
jgi:ABC-type transport system substrate-binding protein